MLLRRWRRSIAGSIGGRGAAKRRAEVSGVHAMVELLAVVSVEADGVRSVAYGNPESLIQRWIGVYP